MTSVIPAAGGLVFKKTPKGNIRILVAHRPAYDDWALPKGKADESEAAEATAVREVLEETGYHCRIVASLPSTEHPVDGGIKRISWFAMRPLPDSPGFSKNSEIDRIAWLSPKKAQKRVDYENDRGLIEGARWKGLSRTGTLRFLRHAVARDRNAWAGDDLYRPLTAKGHRQARRIATGLRDAGVDRVLSSPYARCVESVEPLAHLIGAEVEVTDRLAESTDIDQITRFVDSLAGYNAVLSTHGEVVPAVLDHLTERGLSLQSRLYCSKGSVWEVAVEGGRYTEARYRPPPRV